MGSTVEGVVRKFIVDYRDLKGQEPQPSQTLHHINFIHDREISFVHPYICQIIIAPILSILNMYSVRSGPIIFLPVRGIHQPCSQF